MGTNPKLVIMELLYWKQKLGAQLELNMASICLSHRVLTHLLSIVKALSFTRMGCWILNQNLNLES
jgi:hypothetical protein